MDSVGQSFSDMDLERSICILGEGVTLNWAFAGASAIAGQYMVGVIRAVAGNGLCWIVSGSSVRADEFARTHDIPYFGTDLDAALADPALDALYISSTNDKHAAQPLAAIAAGKHVLC